MDARRILRHPVYPVAMLYMAGFAVSGTVSQETGPPANFAYATVALSLLLVQIPATIVAAQPGVRRHVPAPGR